MSYARPQGLRRAAEVSNHRSAPLASTSRSRTSTLKPIPPSGSPPSGSARPTSARSQSHSRPTSASHHSTASPPTALEVRTAMDAPDTLQALHTLKRTHASLLQEHAFLKTQLQRAVALAKKREGQLCELLGASTGDTKTLENRLHRLKEELMSVSMLTQRCKQLEGELHKRTLAHADNGDDKVDNEVAVERDVYKNECERLRQVLEHKVYMYGALYHRYEEERRAREEAELRAKEEAEEKERRARARLRAKFKKNGFVEKDSGRSRDDEDEDGEDADEEEGSGAYPIVAQEPEEEDEEFPCPHCLLQPSAPTPLSREALTSLFLGTVVTESSAEGVEGDGGVVHVKHMSLPHARMAVVRLAQRIREIEESAATQIGMERGRVREREDEVQALQTKCRLLQRQCDALRNSDREKSYAAGVRERDAAGTGTSALQDLAQELNRIRAERDAALRERDGARKESNYMAGEVATLKEKVQMLVALLAVKQEQEQEHLAELAHARTPTAAAAGDGIRGSAGSRSSATVRGTPASALLPAHEEVDDRVLSLHAVMGEVLEAGDEDAQYVLSVEKNKREEEARMRAEMEERERKERERMEEEEAARRMAAQVEREVKERLERQEKEEKERREMEEREEMERKKREEAERLEREKKKQEEELRLFLQQEREREAREKERKEKEEMERREREEKEQAQRAEEERERLEKQQREREQREREEREARERAEADIQAQAQVSSPAVDSPFGLLSVARALQHKAETVFALPRDGDDDTNASPEGAINTNTATGLASGNAASGNSDGGTSADAGMEAGLVSLDADISIGEHADLQASAPAPAAIPVETDAPGLSSSLSLGMGMAVVSGDRDSPHTDALHSDSVPTDAVYDDFLQDDTVAPVPASPSADVSVLTGSATPSADAPAPTPIATSTPTYVPEPSYVDDDAASLPNVSEVLDSSAAGTHVTQTSSSLVDAEAPTMNMDTTASSSATAGDASDPALVDTLADTNINTGINDNVDISASVPDVDGSAFLFDDSFAVHEAAPPQPSSPAHPTADTHTTPPPVGTPERPMAAAQGSVAAQEPDLAIKDTSYAVEASSFAIEEASFTVEESVDVAEPLSTQVEPSLDANAPDAEVPTVVALPADTPVAVEAPFVDATTSDMPMIGLSTTAMPISDVLASNEPAVIDFSMDVDVDEYNPDIEPMADYDPSIVHVPDHIPVIKPSDAADHTPEVEHASNTRPVIGVDELDTVTATTAVFASTPTSASVSTAAAALVAATGVDNADASLEILPPADMDTTADQEKHPETAIIANSRADVVTPPAEDIAIAFDVALPSSTVSNNSTDTDGIQPPPPLSSEYVDDYDDYDDDYDESIPTLPSVPTADSSAPLVALDASTDFPVHASEEAPVGENEVMPVPTASLRAEEDSTIPPVSSAVSLQLNDSAVALTTLAPVPNSSAEQTVVPELSETLQKVLAVAAASASADVDFEDPFEDV